MATAQGKQPRLSHDLGQALPLEFLHELLKGPSVVRGVENATVHRHRDPRVAAALLGVPEEALGELSRQPPAHLHQ